ncbi:hypothetical protein A0U40_10860 [[Bacillus] sp. KCTC 13219]|nr:hypothetical protein A0U40_10860 [[Bacillus] sp. KCTC 13219]
MKKNSLKLLLLIALVPFIYFSNSVSAEGVQESKIVNVEVFPSTFIHSNDFLINRALDGDEVSTEYRDIIIIENEENDEIQVEIDTILKRTTYEDGTVIEDKEKLISTFATVTGPYSHSKNSQAIADSYAVRVDMGISYQSILVNGTITGYKLSNFTISPILLDNQFSLTTLKYEARSYGPGYLINGTPTSTLETTGVQTITPATTVHRTVYWTKYVVPSMDGFGTGITGSLTYKRNISGASYTLNYVIAAN